MNFKYVAINSEGKRIEGNREADSREDVVNFLLNQDLTIVSISENINLDFKKILSSDIGGLPLAEKLVLVKQLSTMISAGIPLLQALDILVQQTEKEALKEKLQKVYEGVESGQTLSKSFAKVGGIFSEVQLSLISAGEQSGNLAEMLLKVTDDLEESKNLRGKIVGALIYPAIILTVLVVVVVVMIVFMVPQIEALYESLNRDDLELPITTRFFIFISNFFRNPFGLIIFLISMFGLYLGFRAYASTPGGRLNVDRFKLKIPVFGKLIIKAELTQFTRVLSMLLQSGIPIIESIKITAEALGNEAFKQTVKASVDGVKKGESLSVSLAKNNKYNVLPLILLKMIATGEESGKLDKVLEDISRFYNAEVKQTTDNLTKLLEPFILLFAGVMVAFLALSIYLPIYQIMNAVQ
ncbi:MAG: type II secretion system protein F [Candidatus Dojkabacteria bacterium]|nr:MAG: type II secretion system protein F [Candidatus Dojkabacteria bacterium]